MPHHKALSARRFGEKVEKRKDERPQDQAGAATGWDGFGASEGWSSDMTQDVTVRVELLQFGDDRPG